ncbi:hypothetical protein T492DRAFT_905486 [Pavlovales sp. CCMP2436]|nr:hypothetical protein T492DRAFT_905486 [Pavlovales sp. CCMP2436]
MLVLLLAASAMVARPPIGRASVLRSSMTALRKSLTAWDPTGIAKWGWWVVIGYMFAAQAKVCDEFFVPAIEVPLAAPEVFRLPLAAPEVFRLPLAAPEVFRLPLAAPEVFHARIHARVRLKRRH